LYIAYKYDILFLSILYDGRLIQTMKFAKGTDKVLTIIYTVISILLILAFILSLIYAGSLMNHAGSTALKTGNYSADDVTAGYQVIGNLFSGGLSFTASVFLYIIAIYAAFFALPLVIITIFAYIGMALYKKTNNPKHIRRNLIVKIIYTCIWTILALIMAVNDVGFVVIFVILAFILSLLFGALYGMSDHEYFSEY
jgi:uncharacterized membrane protein